MSAVAYVWPNPRRSQVRLAMILSLRVGTPKKGIVPFRSWGRPMGCQVQEGVVPKETPLRGAGFSKPFREVSFPVCNGNFPVRIAGNSSKRAFSRQWIREGGRGVFNANSLYLPKDQGIQISETRSP